MSPARFDWCSPPPIADKAAEIVAIMAETRSGSAVELVPTARLRSGKSTRPGTPWRPTPASRRVAVSEATGLRRHRRRHGARGRSPGWGAWCLLGPLRGGARHLRRQRGQAHRRAGRPGETPRARARARFVTVAMAVFPGGREVTAEGVTEGTIARWPRGAEGFGYDPVFVPDDGDGRTFAQMSAPEKHALSHRGRAFRALAAKLIRSLTGRHTGRSRGRMFNVPHDKAFGIIAQASRTSYRHPRGGGSGVGGKCGRDLLRADGQHRVGLLGPAIASAPVDRHGGGLDVEPRARLKGRVARILQAGRPHRGRRSRRRAGACEPSTSTGEP